jgi:hypothetical protein
VSAEDSFVRQSVQGDFGESPDARQYPRRVVEYPLRAIGGELDSAKVKVVGGSDHLYEYPLEGVTFHLLIPHREFAHQGGVDPSSIIYLHPGDHEVNMLGIILLILLVVLLLGAIPVWPYSSGWGYYPAGLLVALGVVIIVLLGRVCKGMDEDYTSDQESWKR